MTIHLLTSSARKVVASIALTLATAGFIPVCASAQTAQRVESCGPNDVVPWWPRFTAKLGAETLTAAERATVERRLGAVEALARKSPYATARGFAVEPIFGFHEITNRTQLYPYLFALDTKDRCSKYDEYPAHLIVNFNPDPMAWSAGDRPLIDERGEALYIERPRREAILGSTATFGGFHEDNTNTSAFFLLFTTANEPPTLPVSREEYLRYRILEHEGKDQEKLKAVTANLSKTPYERWVEDAPARKKRNEELLAVIAKVNAAQVAKTRADTEKVEQAEVEKLKRADAFEREKQAKDLATYKGIGDRYRAQITAMSPQERSSPALMNGLDLVPQGTPNAYMIVRKNAAFYHARTSPLEARAILVSMPGACKEERPQQEQLYKQFDWAALKKMVNP
jgi:hypothetical protein